MFIEHKDDSTLPKGYRWVYCKKHRVRNSNRYIYAEDYGYDFWRFPVRIAE